MQSQTDANSPLLKDIYGRVFELTWHDSRRYLQIMEIYAPNSEQCFRLVELMKAVAIAEGWKTAGVLVSRCAEQAGDTWVCLTIKFPEFMTEHMEHAFRVARDVRKDFARKYFEANGNQDPRQ